MPKLLRLKDLKADGVVNSWPQLKTLVEQFGFPPGRYLSAQCRVWTEDEVAKWVASRPLAKTETGKPEG
jgi:hypothetical protein